MGTNISGLSKKNVLHTHTIRRSINRRNLSLFINEKSTGKAQLFLKKGKRKKKKRYFMENSMKW